MAIATVTGRWKAWRARLIQFKSGELTIKDWPRLTAQGDFSPDYLHLKRAVRI